jgi:hypothetical protein
MRKWIEPFYLMKMIKVSFQLLLLLSAMLLSNCRERLAEAQTPTVIPGTGCLVTLQEPDFKHHYSYTISAGNKVLVNRFLGPVTVISTDKPFIVKEGFQRYRISWGSGPSAAFALIDFNERKIIADTNQANPANQPF